MKKIAVISTGYLWFPCEKGYLRVFDICMALTQAGFLVDTFVPDFQHHAKAPRDIELIKSQKYPFGIIPIHAPAYKRNIGVGRVASNNALAKNVRQALALRISEYDAVFVSVPPNDVAAEVVKICNKAMVPCLTDVEDLWPEAMAMVVKNDGLRGLMFSKFKKDAEYVYAHTDAVSGTSQDYTDRAFKENKRDIPTVTAHVGVDLEKFDKAAKENVDFPNKPEGEFWVTYAGSISNSYDIETLVKAGEILENINRKDIKIKILGTGVKVEELKAYISEKDITCVEFKGFVPYEKMCSYLEVSDILINSFVKNAPQSIVNKVGDYFAAARPMINSLETRVFTEIVRKNKVGINVEPGNPGELSSAILELYSDKDKRDEMGKRARSLCEKSFDRKKENEKLIKVLRSLVEK